MPKEELNSTRVKNLRLLLKQGMVNRGIGESENR